MLEFLAGFIWWRSCGCSQNHYSQSCCLVQQTLFYYKHPLSWFFFLLLENFLLLSEVVVLHLLIGKGNHIGLYSLHVVLYHNGKGSHHKPVLFPMFPVQWMSVGLLVVSLTLLVPSILPPTLPHYVSNLAHCLAVALHLSPSAAIWSRVSLIVAGIGSLPWCGSQAGPVTDLPFS